jgi:hypothetical protein
MNRRLERRIFSCETAASLESFGGGSSSALNVIDNANDNTDWTYVSIENAVFCDFWGKMR